MAGSPLRVTLFARLYGQMINNVIGFEWKVPGAQTYDQLGADIKTNVVDQLANVCRTQIQWYQMILKKTDGNDAPFTYVFTPKNGVNGGDPIYPAYNTMIFSLRTAVAGREGRGRFYLSGFAGQIQNGLHEAFQLNGAIIAANNMMTRYGPSGTSTALQLAILNRAGTIYRHVTAITPKATPGVQRRRNLGVGV